MSSYASETTTYTWNPRNQLTAISGGGTTASFLYDGLGRRLRKTVNGANTEFLYDGLNPVQERDGAAVLANLLTNLGIDEYLTRTDASGTKSLLPDALGSTVALADAAGAVQTAYTYEPFGGTTVSGTASTSAFQYTGRENDGTGLYYYRARYYHPGLGRFVSEDPVEFDGGDVNLYAYVSNDPVNLLDPLGEAALVIPTDLSCPIPGRKDPPVWLEVVAAIVCSQPDPLSILPGGGATVLARSTAIGVHAAGRMLARGITRRMVETALQKGQRFFDPVHQTAQYVVDFASGKWLVVSQNPVTKNITTVMVQQRVSPRFVPWPR